MSKPTLPAVEPEARGTVRAAADLVLVGLFLVAIAVPATGVFWSDAEATIKAVEKRMAAAFPRLEYRPGRYFPRTESVEAFPRGFEAWFGDRVGFRGPLIGAYMAAKSAGLASDVAARAGGEEAAAIVGTDGWLYFTGDSSLDDYRCNRPFTRDELDRWKAALTARRDWLRERGIAYLVVIAPSKHTIYPEHLPRWLNKVGSESRQDQLLAHLSGPDAVPVLDLRPALLDAKGREPVYHKTDTHWNDLGAFVGYERIMEAVAVRFPEAAAKARGDFRLRTTTGRAGGDLARMLGAADAYPEEGLRLVPTTPRLAEIDVERNKNDRRKRTLTRQPAAELGRVTVLHDSFTVALLPFLAEHWREGDFVWTYDFPADLIEETRPQLVIQEYVERRLMDHLPTNPPDLSRPSRAPVPPIADRGSERH